MNYNELNSQFAIPGYLEFLSGKGSLPVVRITNQHASAEVSLYGAHVLSFVPAGQKDILWMSPQSLFEHGKAIRGGIPVCFPWFGPHSTDSNKPAHGFVRLQMWNVVETLKLTNGNIRLILGLKESAESMALWPFPFSAKMIIEVGKTLDVTLSCINTGSEEFIVGGALHSYFSVSNIANISISGLKDTAYYKGFEKEASGKQTEESIKITQEENRRYIDTTTECIIKDTEMKRSIRVAKRGSKVTVVWNPYSETVKTMADIPPAGYLDFVCVEAVNAYTDTFLLKPGEMHSLATVLSVE